MRVQAITRTIQVKEWASQIQERITSGLTVRAWCAQRGQSPKTYYYHLRRVREELLEKAKVQNVPELPAQTVFTALPVPPADRAAVTVRIGENVAEITDGTSAATIECVLRVLGGL